MARSLGLTPRTIFFISRGLQKRFDPGYHLGRKQQLVRARLLISLRLYHYMSWTKPHAVGNRLLVPAIEQTQRDQQQRETQTQRQCCNAYLGDFARDCAS